MIRKIAQLTRFIDQTGLCLANRPVTNKPHFSLLPNVVFVASMLHGTARGEIQLPTAHCIAGPLILRSGLWAASRRMTTAPVVASWFETREDALLTMRETLRDHALSGKLESVAVAPDVPRAEMSADHPCSGIGETGEQFAPRHRRLHGVGIGGRRPVEMGHLAGMMGDVAGQQGLFAVRLDVNAHMARTVARRWNQGDFIAEPGVAADKLGLAGIDDRLHRVVEDSRPVWLLAMVAPVLVFGFAEPVASVGQG